MGKEKNRHRPDSSELPDGVKDFRDCEGCKEKMKEKIKERQKDE